jgi:aminoglycoside phosphotransferase (APT) family kinase protein
VRHDPSLTEREPPIVWLVGGTIGAMTSGGAPGLRALAGGFSGETFLAESAGERSVVRVYGGRGAARGPRASEVDAAVLRLVQGLVPVPEVLEFRGPDPAAGTPGLLVTSFLPGARFDLLLPTLDDHARRTTGRALGDLLGRLAMMPMPRRGAFTDGALCITPFPFPDLRSAIVAAVGATALSRWPTADLDLLLELADNAQDRLDRVTRTCLVHGDANPKNLLVDPTTLAVTGLLDWEFAHGGVPGSDLGNLLRFERDEVFTRAVLDGYRRRVVDAGADVLELARAADLPALVDLAGRRGENPVTERAHAQLLAMARAGDLAATP